MQPDKRKLSLLQRIRFEVTNCSPITLPVKHVNLVSRQKQTFEPGTARRPQRDVPFITASSRPVEALYTRQDLADRNLEHDADIGYPGEFPYTRGVHPTGYRGKLWTMRQFAGFGTAEDSNERYRRLLESGQTISTSVSAVVSATTSGPSARSPIFVALSICNKINAAASLMASTAARRSEFEPRRPSFWLFP